MIELPFVGLARRTGLGAFGVSVATALPIAGLLLAGEAWNGELQQLLEGTGHAQLSQDFRVATVLLLVLAYMAGSQVYVAHRAETCLRALAPALGLGSDELEERAARLSRIDRGRLLSSALWGMVLAIGISFLPEVAVAGRVEVGQLGLLAIAHRLMVAGIGLIAGSTISGVLHIYPRVSALADAAPRFDILELTPWLPLTRLGLSNAYATAGLISLLLLLLPDREAGEGMTVALAIFFVTIPAAAVVGLLVPIRDLRRRIRVQKRERLGACEQRIRKLLDPGGSSNGPGELADRIAERELLRAVPEWPLDLSRNARVALLIGLPLVSWIAAALVERVLDAAIG